MNTLLQEIKDRTNNIGSLVLFIKNHLKVGDPKRTSKSFDSYNKVYGPMIVRIVKTI